MYYSAGGQAELGHQRPVGSESRAFRQVGHADQEQAGPDQRQQGGPDIKDRYELFQEGFEVRHRSAPGRLERAHEGKGAAAKSKSRDTARGAKCGIEEQGHERLLEQNG